MISKNEMFNINFKYKKISIILISRNIICLQCVDNHKLIYIVISIVLNIICCVVFFY